jgi:RimJ/RimL family protein N-acetyltransferase
MLGRLIDDARAAERLGIELTTVPGNERAFQLYRRAGFIHLGDVDNVAGDGRVVREHRMFLPLQAGASPPARHFGPPL